MSRWIAATAIAFALAVPAAAQDARELFEQGNAATEAGRFADARDLYRRSLELEPNPASAFNLAVALTRTGEFVEAATLFEELLEGSFGRLSRTQRREVRALQREASENVATLRVELPPVEEVEIRVDGERIEGAVAHVDPGEHLVSVSSPRHRPVEDRVVVERGEERRYQPTLQLRPDLTMGRLVVEGPEGGHLSVDGVAEAMGRLDLNLEAGTYELSLQADGRATDREVVVEAGTTSRYEITLAPRRRVWLWIVGAVLVAGGVATALVLTRTEQPPREDPVYGTISTLRF